MSDYHRTMGQIAQVARQLVGGKDINGFYSSAATIENAGPLTRALRELLDEYDRQMIDMVRKYDDADNLSAPLKGNIEVRPTYSEGIMGDGAAILRDGYPMKVHEIVAALNRRSQDE